MKLRLEVTRRCSHAGYWLIGTRLVLTLAADAQSCCRSQVVCNGH
jgi:hypothetical protein